MRQWHRKNKNKGFSLLELVVVIAIMAVLAGVLIPSMITASNDARRDADDAIMNDLAQIYKSAVQEHETYYFFSRTVDLMDDGEKAVYFWYNVDREGNVTYDDMNWRYPDGVTADEKHEIDTWAAKLEQNARDYVNGSFEMPVMESKDSFKKSYVIEVAASGREYLVHVKSAWED